MVSASHDLSVDVQSRKRKQQMAPETHTHLGLPEVAWCCSWEKLLGSSALQVGWRPLVCQSIGIYFCFAIQVGWRPLVAWQIWSLPRSPGRFGHCLVAQADLVIAS